MNNIIEDVSKLTSISKDNLEKLVKLSVYSILETISEDKLQDKDVSEVDIGLGKLYIRYSGGELTYKFIPSEFLLDETLKTLRNDKNTFEVEIEDNIVNRVTKLYKEIL